ncbi:hypothetical protein RF55_7985 [Lasius niger]|uniref:Uncharacterized protein n=1 Tax=Lasius niger TaxID=67767 RepID=A0A0J7KP98_LASNI|nr:hypothetical protein RF55_7985 [Lasius niger]
MMSAPLVRIPDRSPRYLPERSGLAGPLEVPLDQRTTADRDSDSRGCCGGCGGDDDNTGRRREGVPRQRQQQRQRNALVVIVHHLRFRLFFLPRHLHLLLHHHLVSLAGLAVSPPPAADADAAAAAAADAADAVPAVPGVVRHFRVSATTPATAAALDARDDVACIEDDLMRKHLNNTRFVVVVVPLPRLASSQCGAPRFMLHPERPATYPPPSPSSSPCTPCCCCLSSPMITAGGGTTARTTTTMTTTTMTTTTTTTMTRTTAVVCRIAAPETSLTHPGDTLRVGNNRSNNPTRT